MSVVVFVPDLPEFASLVSNARTAGGCEVGRIASGYWRIEAAHELRFTRRQLGLGPALWNSALCGGFRARIAVYDRNEMRLVEEDAPS